MGPTMQVKDPKPEIMRLEELALLVQSGEIKLPRFQRPFVWKESDMLKLLDSIYKGYPIGSILIWNSSQKLTSERSISGLELNTEARTFFPTNYLLDGQQRLTTLCGALFWNGTDPNSIWNIHFDLDSEEFVRTGENRLTNLFPLNRLITTKDFIRQCMKFDHHPKRDEYYKLAERLLKSIKDYKIAVVKIGDMTIEEVAPIFERINSTGRKLTIVDLMMAATWSNGFDLTNEIQRIKTACDDLGFQDVSDQIILRSIAASADLGINKDDIQRLRSKNPTELAGAADAAREGLLRALTLLKQRIGIHDYSYIPYGFQLTYLAEYFRLVPEPTQQVLTHLVEWFWYTSAARYFAATNSGQVSKDLALVRSYALGKRSRLFEKETIDISRLLFDRFNLRNATSTSFTTLLNNRAPSQTLDGAPIDGSHLEVKSSKFYISYCPKGAGLEQLNISRVIHPYSVERMTVSRQIPPPNVADHIIDQRCLEAIATDDAEGFLSARSTLVATLLTAFTGCTVTYKLPSLPFNEDIDDENSEAGNGSHSLQPG